MNFLRIFINLFHFNRTNWKAVALCFLAATVFWLFNTLNKQYTTSLRFPLHFQFDESAYAPAEELPKTIGINVSGNGWDLVRKTLGVRLPVLSIPLERADEIRKINTANLTALLSSQLDGLSINFITVDTLRLRIDKRTTRLFRMVADPSSLTFKNGIGRTSPVTLHPDTVELTGPLSLISALPDSIVVALPSRKVNGAYRDEVEVVMPHHHLIKRNPPVVEAQFDVSPLSSVAYQLPVVTPSLPWGLVVVEDSVTATVLVPQSLTTSLSSRDWIAKLQPEDVPESALAKGEQRRVVPIVVSLPPYSVLVQIDSITLRQH